MSGAATLDSTSTVAVVTVVDLVQVGSKQHYFIQCEYLDQMTRPDIVGQTSGWLRTEVPTTVGDILSIGFTPVPNRLGSTEWKPYIKR